MKVNAINLNTNYKMSFKGNNTDTTITTSNTNNIVAPVPPIQGGDSTQFKQALKVKKSFLNKSYELLRDLFKQPRVELGQWRPGMTTDEIAAIRTSLY